MTEDYVFNNIPVDYVLDSKEINPFLDFSDYSFWVFNKVIYYNEEADKWLIQPEYHKILVDDDMGPEKANCEGFDWSELYRMLQVETDRRNALRDKSKKVIDGLASFFEEVVDPIITDKAVEFFDLLKYFKDKEQSLEEINDEIENKEKIEAKKQELREKIGHLNFAKK